MKSQTGKLSPTEALVDQVVELRYEDLPEDVTLTVKKATLDTFACVLAGSSYKNVPEMVGLLKKWGGAREATIQVYGDKVPAPHAAFANAVMARAIDMADFHPASAHVSAYIIPTMLAMAELQGGASGRDFITAYVAGAEPSHRITSAAGGMDENSKRGRYLGTGGKLGAALSAAKLHHLNKEQTADALGLAYVMSTAWSLVKASPVGSASAYFEHGYQCEDAIEHVLLAQLGVTGPKEILTGVMGIYNQFFPWKEVDPASVVADWGKKWLTTGTLVKRFPACGLTHAPIQVLLDLIAEKDIRHQDIASIDLKISSAALEVTGRPEHWHPSDEREAKFSLPFVIATAAIKRKVFVDDFNPREIARKDMRDLMDKITVEASAAMPVVAATVTIKLKDGRNLTKSGRQKESVTWEELIDKLHRCAALSAKPVPESNLTQLLRDIQHLDELTDVTALTRLITNKT